MQSTDVSVLYVSSSVPQIYALWTVGHRMIFTMNIAARELLGISSNYISDIIRTYS